MSGLDALNYSRQLLDTALSKLDDKDLHVQLNDRSKPISEMIVHIASFEYLTAGCAAVESGAEFDFGLWPKLKSGFSQEIGWEGPALSTISECRDILSEVRNLTSDVLRDDTVLSDKLIEVFFGKLASTDDSLTDDQMSKLIAVFRASAMAHGAVMMSAAAALQSHEAYHRGQIFLQRHLV